MSFRGTNYGTLTLGAESLQMASKHHSAPIFSIPYNSINNSTMNKNDIIIETASEEVGNQDCICQIRFHVEDRKEGDEEMQVQGQAAEKMNFAQEIYQKIVEKAKLGQFAGQSIATLLDVNLAVPRGKYTIDFSPKTLRFHGQTFNYNVDHKNITKGFILPMMNESQISIVLQLDKDKPIYQGQTVYRYIVVQIKKEIEVIIKTKLNPEVIEKSPHLKELQEEYQGPLYQVFISLMKSIYNIVLVQPGDHFKSKAGQPCVKCNVKAQSGWLYFLKQSLIFIPKPVLYFKIQEISSVEFTRLGALNKQFDMKITLKEHKNQIEFFGLERPELQALVQYLKARNVKVLMEQQTSKIIPADALDDDQQEDQDFQADQDSEDDESVSESAQIGSEEDSASNSKEKKSKEKKKEKKHDKKHHKQAKAQE